MDIHTNIDWFNRLRGGGANMDAYIERMQRPNERPDVLAIFAVGERFSLDIEVHTAYDIGQRAKMTPYPCNSQHDRQERKVLLYHIICDGTYYLVIGKTMERQRRLGQ